MLRSKLISDLANRILNLRIYHPVRVGVSGITASGKTTFANELAVDFNAEERRLDLCNLNDFKIFVDTDFEVARERGLKEKN